MSVIDLTDVAAGPFAFCMSAVLWRPCGMSDDEIRAIPNALRRLLCMPREDPRVEYVLFNLGLYYQSTPEHMRWALVCERLRTGIMPAGQKRTMRTIAPSQPGRQTRRRWIAARERAVLRMS